ncbi:MAG: hypothetical protein ACI8W9_001607 [Psychromonas sp.]
MTTCTAAKWKTVLHLRFMMNIIFFKRKSSDNIYSAHFYMANTHSL